LVVIVVPQGDHETHAFTFDEGVLGYDWILVVNVNVFVGVYIELQKCVVKFVQDLAEGSEVETADVV